MTTAKERQMGEIVGRERKAARLAVRFLKICWAYGDWVPSKELVCILSQPEIREELMNKAGYGHVSDETWARVEELVGELAV